MKGKKGMNRNKNNQIQRIIEEINGERRQKRIEKMENIFIWTIIIAWAIALFMMLREMI